MTIRRMRCGLTLIALLAVAPARADEHLEHIQGYALLVAGTSYAESHCPRMKVSEGALTVIARFAGVNHEDFDTVTEAGARAMQDVADAYAKVGQERWCAQAWTLFGPEGTFLAGVLERGG